MSSSPSSPFNLTDVKQAGVFLTFSQLDKALSQPTRQGQPFVDCDNNIVYISKVKV